MEILTVIIIYLIFCIATSLTASLYIIKPALSYIYLLDPLPKFAQDTTKKVAHFAFFIVGLAFAPILFFVLLSKGYSDRAIVKIKEDLQKD